MVTKRPESTGRAPHIEAAALDRDRALELEVEQHRRQRRRAEARPLGERVDAERVVAKRIEELTVPGRPRRPGEPRTKLGTEPLGERTQRIDDLIGALDEHRAVADQLVAAARER